MNAEPLPPEVEALVRQAVDAAALETAARVLALQLIREFGVTVPRRALESQAAQRKLDPVSALVLAKLQAVAKILGSP